MNCPKCTSSNYSVHSHISRSIRDIINGQESCLDVDITKYTCKHCQHIFASPYYPKSGMTTDYQFRIVQRCLNESYLKISEDIGLSDVTIRKTFNNWMDKKFPPREIPAFIGIFLIDKTGLIFSVNGEILDIQNNISKWIKERAYVKKLFLTGPSNNFSNVLELLISLEDNQIDISLDKKPYEEYLYSLLNEYLENINLNSFQKEDFFIENNYCISIWPDEIQKMYKIWWDTGFKKPIGYPRIDNIIQRYNQYIKDDYLTTKISFAIYVAMYHVPDYIQYNGLHLKHYLLEKLYDIPKHHL